MVYTVENLLSDAASNRNSVTRRGKEDIIQAWDALNRYITDIMEKHQTINVSNFCKIGWRVDASLHGRLGEPHMRPHFNVSEAFARVVRADPKSMLQVPESLASVEEFNFSKCALRFSQGLTKDIVFMGLRAIIQQLGEVIGSGQDVSIDFECGTLQSSQRIVTFSFLADYYLREGMDVPPHAAQQSAYRPSNTFSAPSQDALSLSVAGSNQFRGTTKATELGGFSDSGIGLPGMTDFASEPESTQVSHLSPRPWHNLKVRGDTDGSMFDPGYEASTVPSSNEDVVQQQAMERHIAMLQSEAAYEVKSQNDWQSHLQRCLAEEKKEMDWRNAIARDYQESLKDQIRVSEQKRADGRRNHVEQASMHDFPDFSKAPEISVHDYIMERRRNLKDDLDQQVELKLRQKEAQKLRDLELDHMNTEATMREMQQQRHYERARSIRATEECKNSWAQSKRVNDAKKAISAAAKSQSAASGLTDMIGSLRSSELASNSDYFDGSQTQRTPRRGQATLGMDMPMQGPGTPRGSSGASSSRPTTGSTRRFPISAAASLALTKQRMKERGMM